MSGITWANERVKLRDLEPWNGNPRTISDKSAELLARSVEDFGQVETLAVGPENELYNGHQRLNVLAGQYGLDYEVDVRRADRALSEQERKRLTAYLHQGAAGEWDWDALAEWDYSDLTEWGFDSDELDERFGEMIAPEFKEYTEEIENEVEMMECPHCGESFPK